MQATQNNAQRVSECFATGWEDYLEFVRLDVLHHTLMFDMLDKILRERVGDIPFSLADCGCGDSSSIARVIKNKPLTRYIGMDASADLIDRSKRVLAELKCEKEFIVADMRGAIKELNGPVDVISSSFALHHLSTDDKELFFADAKQKIKIGGMFILIDGVLPKGATREDYMAQLEKSLRDTCPNVSDEDVARHMEHPRLDDFPDPIMFFEETAQKQGWQNFEIIIDKGIFGMMVFTR